MLPLLLLLVLQALETETLPAGMCRPAMLRVASPVVRRSCEHFPAAAAALVRANGLRPEEFDRLRQRCEKNPLYRFSVLQAVRKLNEAEESDY